MFMNMVGSSTNISIIVSWNNMVEGFYYNSFVLFFLFLNCFKYNFVGFFRGLFMVSLWYSWMMSMMMLFFLSLSLLILEFIFLFIVESMILFKLLYFFSIFGYESMRFYSSRGFGFDGSGFVFIWYNKVVLLYSLSIWMY